MVLLSFAPSIMFLVELSFVEHVQSLWLLVPLLALQMVPFCSSSVFAPTFVHSYSLFTPEPKAPPSSTLFFFLKTFLGKFVAKFFLFSNVVCISSLVLLTLVGGLCGFSF